MPLIENKRNASEINKSFISLILPNDVIEIKKSKNESPIMTTDENNNSSSIVTPLFSLYSLYIKVFLVFFV